jgi:hypothetical protein
MYALFKNGEFIGYSPDNLFAPDITVKEIPQDQQDLSIWKWSGGLNGKMILILDEGYPQEQIETEEELFKKIHIKYPLGVQLVNIIRQVKKISNHLDCTDDKFSDMAEDILSAIDMYDNRIKHRLNRKKLS